MMSFSEYMSLKENFDHPADQSVGHDFGEEPANTAEKDFAPGQTQDKKFGEEACCEGEDCCDNDSCDDEDFGDIRFDVPEDQGYDAAKSAADQFVDAGDVDPEEDLALDDMYDEMANISKEKIEGLSAEAKQNLREAVEFILNTLNEEEYEVNGEDPDDHIDADGVDTNTIVPHNAEEDQFSAVEDIDNELEESATGWADLF